MDVVCMFAQILFVFVYVCERERVRVCVRV